MPLPRTRPSRLAPPDAREVRRPLALASALASALACLSAAGLARGEGTLVLDGQVEAGEPTHELVAFEVPAGTAEIEVRHASVGDEDNVLDWGLNDPKGFRGWGGGNEEPAIVGEKASSRSYHVGPIEPGTWHVVIGKANIAVSPAPYELEIILRDAPTLAPQTRSKYEPAAALEKKARFYAGDFHVHSLESGDAKPTLDEIAAHAKKVGLDFVEISDHNVLTQLEFFGAAQAAHPELLFLPGMEYTTYAGHANAIGLTSWVDHKVGVGGVTIGAVVEEIRGGGALFAPNHPMLDVGAFCIGCAWKQETSAAELDAVEIQTKAISASLLLHGANLEFWDGLLDEGRHVPPIGGSDDHKGGLGEDAAIGSPTTMVYAEELSASGILAGLKRGRTVVKLEAPTDPMVELESSVAPDGDTVSAASTTLEARITGAPAGYSVRWVKNGKPLEENGVQLDRVAIPSEDFTVTLKVQPPAGATEEDRYRVEVFDDSANPRTITSHLWVRQGTAIDPRDAAGASGDVEDGGCGCRVPGAARAGGPGAALLLGLAGALAASVWLGRRRDRRRS